MNEAVESAYFNWLCHKVFNVKSADSSLTYWTLFRQLHGTEFMWILPMDENRAKDGQDLRTEFIRLYGVPDDPSWRTMSASVLEVLVAFSKRAEHMTDVPYQNWFWEMLKNLDMDNLNDSSPYEPEDVAWVLETWMSREFDDRGYGSPFPLAIPHRDPRNVDIWYQFCDYVADKLP